MRLNSFYICHSTDYMSKEIPPFLINLINEKDSYFRVSAEDKDRLRKYGQQMMGFIKAKRPVPEKLFEKLFTLFSPIKEEIELAISDKASSIYRTLKDKYQNDKRYDFLYTDKNYDIQYNINLMLHNAIDKAVRHYFLNNPKKKEHILKVCYLSLQEYKFQCPVKIQKDYLTHYKLSAISAYITALLGYHFKYITESINNNTHPENQDLEHAVAHYTQKWEIKKRRK